MRTEQALEGYDQVLAGNQKALQDNGWVAETCHLRVSSCCLFVKVQHGKLCIGQKTDHVPVLLS